MTRWLTLAVALLAVAWVIAIVTAPLLAAPFSTLLYGAGSLLCHQIAERSFHLDGFQLPVCGRCLGLYAGAAMGCVAAASMPAAASKPSLRRGRIVTVAAALPTIATLVGERLAGWPVSNGARWLAALPLGITVAVVVMRALATVHYDGCAPQRPFQHGHPPAPST